MQYPKFYTKILIIATLILYSMTQGFGQSISVSGGSSSLSRSMTFSYHSSGGNVAGGEWIAAEGPITSRTPEDFRQFFEKNPSLRGVRLSVVLNSEGGDLAGGISLGLLIYEAGLWTSVGRTLPEGNFSTIREDGVCYSACAYSFLGGKTRLARAGSIGFHQFYRTAARPNTNNSNAPSVNMAEIQRTVGLIALFLKQVEADPEVLFIASSTPPNELYRPTNDELRRLKITTPTERIFSGWRLEPAGRGAVVNGSSRYHDTEEVHLNLFCRRGSPDQIFLMGSSFQWAPPGTTTSSRTDALRSSVFAVSIKAERQLLRRTIGAEALTDVRVDNSGRAFFTVSLSRAEFQIALQKDLEVQIELPSYLGHAAILKIDRQGLESYSSLAFRLCI